MFAFLMGTAGLASADPVRLLAFGDSLTQGYGLPQGEGLVPQLQTWLDEKGADVEVINGGVSGDTTAGGLARVEWSLSDGVDAMMVLLGGNDLLRGIDPASTRENLDGILAVGAGQDIPMMLIGMQAALNYGSDYKASFDTIYPDLAFRYDTVFVPSYYGAITGGEMEPAALQGYLQADGVHPNAEGVARAVEVLGPAVLDLLERAKQPAGG